MGAMKRKRPGDDYDEDQKLLHQATKALTKEVKRVRTFLLQQAIRKSKMATERAQAKRKLGAHGPDSISDINGASVADDTEGLKAVSEADAVKSAKWTEGAVATESTTPFMSTAEAADTSPPAKEIALIKALQAELAVKICLRRLGLAHTGPAGEEEVKVDGTARLKKLVGQIVEHKRVITVMDELQERVTDRRRAKLAEMEGRSLPGQGRGGKGGREGKSKSLAGGGSREKRDKRKKDAARAHSVTGSTGSAFVSLSGEAPSDEEWASGSKSRADKNASYRPSTTKTTNAERKDIDRIHEPGWAGADRAAGWGRGGGRGGPRGVANKGGRGGGRQSNTPGRRHAGSGQEAAEGKRGGKSGAGSSSIGQMVGLERGRGAAEAGGEAAGNLHGSWAAKRALKEKEKSATKAFTGTRIQFGDDD